MRRPFDPGDTSAAHEAALRLLEYRARSSGEIETRLRQRGFEKGVITAEVERLAAVGLLDDEAFARAWVAERERLSPRSGAMIRYELAGKGVAAEIAAQATAGIDDLAAATAVVKRKRKSGATDEAKLSGLLRRRGFGYETVRHAIAAVDDDAP